MGVIRSKITSTLLAAVTIVSILATTVAPTVGPRAGYVSYGDWLRSQAFLPADVLLEEVLSRVEVNDHSSLRSFLDAVLGEYINSGGDAAALFGADGMEGPQLAAYLHSLLAHIAAEALPVRVFFTPAPVPSYMSDRMSAVGIIAGSAALPLVRGVIADCSATLLHRLPLTFLTSLQPQGP